MKNRHQKAIAVAAALIVVLAFFGQDMLQQMGVKLPSSLTTLPVGPVESTDEAWQTFAAYREAARTHDLDSLQKLSYRLSPTCLDQNKLKECIDLMDNLYEIIKHITPKDIANSVIDQKQAAIQTWGPMVLSFHFIRVENILRLVGIKYCINTETEGCEIDQTDSDADGLWDDSEQFL